MHRPSLAEIRQRWRTVLLLIVVTVSSFILGTFANQVIVQQVQSLAGNHVLVPAPELKVLNTVWVINGTSSLVTGVNLNVTTTNSSSTLQLKLYRIFIQISCLPNMNGTGTEFTCATGQTEVQLPTFLNGTTTIPVSLNPAIDPELTEVHDISYIVTGSLIGPLLTGLVGTGLWVDGPLTIAAYLFTTGSSTGFETCTVGGFTACASGPVFQVVPPSGTNNFWCIAVARNDDSVPPGSTEMWYVRDIGNGITSFDQVSTTSVLNGSCTTFPAPGGTFIPLTSGDYRQI